MDNAKLLEVEMKLAKCYNVNIIFEHHSVNAVKTRYSSSGHLCESVCLGYASFVNELTTDN